MAVFPAAHRGHPWTALEGARSFICGDCRIIFTLLERENS